MATLQAWDTPSDYGGYDPVGHFGVLTKHRDSELLTRVNWDVACERLAEAAGIEAVPNLADVTEDWGADPEQAPAVYYWEAGHWAVGWVQYLMVRPDAPQAVLDEAEAIRDDLASYPILDEERYSETEWELMQDYWANASVRERLDYIRMNNERSYGDVSIFAARRDYVPENSGYLDELLREGL